MSLHDCEDPAYADQAMTDSAEYGNAYEDNLLERIVHDLTRTETDARIRGYVDGMEAQADATYKHARQMGYSVDEAKALAYFDCSE